MKVRLKLSYNEFRALVFILSEIATCRHQSTDIYHYICICEAENLCRKLTQILNDPPKRYYTVTLNSIQIILLLGCRMERLGRYEQVVCRDIFEAIDRQYVFESHHRQLRMEKIFQDIQDEFQISLPEHPEGA